MRLRNMIPLKRPFRSEIVKKSSLSTQGRGMDLTLLVIVIILTLFGLLMVYDSSQFEAFSSTGDKYYYIRSQIRWVILGFISMGVFSFIDYKNLQRIALPFFISTILLLLSVFVPGLGVSAGGAHRWLKISSLTIQPAEIIKLSSIIFFSLLFQTKIKPLQFLLLMGFVVLIIGIFQKDLGSAIVFSSISFGMYFIAGAEILHVLSFLSVGVLCFILFIITSSYRRHRILAFLDPFADTQGYSYHISQVLIALGSGGLLGLGIGQSRQKFSYIPEVTTDSIFSVVGEELGFLGCIILISLITYLIIRCFKIAQHAPDGFGKMLASGLTIWLGTQAALNLAAMVSLVPLTGVPLPFISYGGSALLVDLMAVGILLNISKQIKRI